MTTCACGCGGTPRIATKTNSARGAVKGQPTRYMPGHSSRTVATFRPSTSCVRCGINEIPKGWAKHCRQCRQDLNEANNHRQRVKARIRSIYERLGGRHCRGCDRRFIPPYVASGGPLRKFCNHTCARSYWHGYQGDLRRGAMVVPKAMISIQVIGDRDGWKCHICRKHVNRKDAARDHLIPISHGGDSHPSNLAIAHRLCNNKRHDGRLPAQLRLVG